MKIMSVDLGLSRTGIAVCDPLEMLASPVKVIFEKYEPKLIEQIVLEAKNQNAELIVVGLPLNMDGSKGERAQECERIAEIIEEKSGVNVQMWDERCTTVMSHNALNVTNVRGQKRKNVVDAVAAVMILESYLEYRKNKRPL
ncbi:MAG: Holliday junction resolvase RuvX [Clostridia bacterium]|nr:Holliday junction resolvase RuvX [Clostridia bacterium]